MSITLSLDGIEDAVRRIVREEIAAHDGRAYEWLDAEAAAAYLNVSRGQLHNLVSAGRLPRHGTRGARLRFRRAELDAYQEGY